MPATPTRLAQAQLAATIGTHYTVPGSTTVTDTSILLWNDDTVNRTVTLHFVPSAGSPGADNYILESYVVFPKTPQLVQPKQAILTGGTIRAFADVAGKVALHVSGQLVVSPDTTLVTRMFQSQLAASLTTLYTASPNSILDEAIWVYNFDTSPRTVQCQFIPSGQSAALDYTVMNAYPLQAKSGFALQPGQVIASGGTIRMAADVANKVVAAGTGIQL